jgi:hypothetical protein
MLFAVKSNDVLIPWLIRYNVMVTMMMALAAVFMDEGGR